MSYSQIGIKNSEKKSELHPDAWKNWEWFQKVLMKIIWIPTKENCPVYWKAYDIENSFIYNDSADISKDKYIETKRMKEPLNIIFIYPDMGLKRTFNISFNIPHRNEGNNLGFRENICKALNYLGSLGFIEHIDKNREGSLIKSYHETKDNSAWKALFG